MRRDLQQQLPLRQRLSDQLEIMGLQIAQATVDQLGGSGRGRARPVALLDQRDAQAAQRRIIGGPGAVDAAAADQQVEMASGQRGEIALHFVHATCS
ncbi:MAG: hypothetical protein A2052_01080 [Deltaproteobacteria bacterium GWA2_54_12]|nr:MAG: hypothetical protein A2052_01080 [Deltaproteobacteria bacterium GWA2_54_12]